MLIRTLRPIEVAGRRIRAFACMDVPPAEAAALIDAGDAEEWVPLPPRGAAPPAEPVPEPEE